VLKQLKLRDKEGKGFSKKSRTKWMADYFNQNLKVADFYRTYHTDRRVADLKIPSAKDFAEIYKSMYKFDEKACNINCTACGNNTCREMAVAIFNENNVPY
jgi:hypothetical protein